MSSGPPATKGTYVHLPDNATVLAKICVRRSATLRETLKAIDDGAVSLALVVDDEGRLLGTVSDGDARRALLRHVGLGEAVEGVMNPQPKVARADEPEGRLLERVLGHHLRQIPLVDGAGRV